MVQHDSDGSKREGVQYTSGVIVHIGGEVFTSAAGADSQQGCLVMCTIFQPQCWQYQLCLHPGGQAGQQDAGRGGSSDGEQSGRQWGQGDAAPR